MIQRAELGEKKGWQTTLRNSSGWKVPKGYHDFSQCQGLSQKFYMYLKNMSAKAKG
jgi:hypothetical protein